MPDTTAGAYSTDSIVGLCPLSLTSEVCSTDPKSVLETIPESHSPTLKPMPSLTVERYSLTSTPTWDDEEKHYGPHNTNDEEPEPVLTPTPACEEKNDNPMRLQGVWQHRPTQVYVTASYAKACSSTHAVATAPTERHRFPANVPADRNFTLAKGIVPTAAASTQPKVVTQKTVGMLHHTFHQSGICDPLYRHCRKNPQAYVDLLLKEHVDSQVMKDVKCFMTPCAN